MSRAHAVLGALAAGLWCASASPLLAEEAPNAPSAPSAPVGPAQSPAAPQPPAAELAAAANTSDAAADSEPVEMVVTGSRIEEPLDRAVNYTELIKRSDIVQSGARDAAELLEERAGLQVVRSFRGSELQLRGLDPLYALILIDGDRLPGQIGGATDLTRFGVENIERVEIVRGPGSALYGADAIGGIVNLITRESQRDFEGSVFGSYGTRNTLDLSGVVAGRPLAPLRLQLTGDLHRTDAYRRDGEVASALSARNQWSTGARIAYEPDARNRLVLRGTYMQQDMSGVGSGAGGAVFDRTQLQEQLRATLEHRLKATPKVSLQSRATYSQFRDQYLNDQRNGTMLDQVEDNREHLGQMTSIASFELADRHRTTVGAEQLFQRLDSERLSRLAQRYRVGVFAQHSWLAHESDTSELEIVPGIRLDSDSQFGTQVSPKLALRYRPTTYLELRASYGRGFRAPTFQELLMRFENPSAGYIVFGNPNLGAETSHGVDAGARLWNETFELNVTLFRNDLRNMIATVSRVSSAGGTEFTYDNLQYAWTMGVESMATMRVRDALKLSLAYTLLDTWNGEDQRTLEGRAPHRLSANLRLAYPPAGLELIARGALIIGRTYYVAEDGMNEDGSGDPDTAVMDRKVVPGALKQLDLRIAKHFGEVLELFIGIDNVLDTGDQYSVLRPFTVYGGARGRI
ncbi:MAG: TonB-dependent receptor [Polyangiales bacterium]